MGSLKQNCVRQLAKVTNNLNTSRRTHNWNCLSDGTQEWHIDQYCYQVKWSAPCSRLAKAVTFIKENWLQSSIIYRRPFEALIPRPNREIKSDDARVRSIRSKDLAVRCYFIFGVFVVH